MYFVIVDTNRNNLVLDYAQGSIRAHYEELGERLLTFTGTLPPSIRQLTTRVTVRSDGSPAVVAITQPVATPIDNLREAVLTTRDRLIQWSVEIETVGRTQIVERRAKGQNILALAHVGMAFVVVHSAFTIAQRIRFCEQTALGASDVTSPAEFFVLSDDLRDPINPTVWVEPSTGVRLTLAAGLAFSLTDRLQTMQEEFDMVSGMDFSSPSWVNSITT